MRNTFFTAASLAACLTLALASQAVAQTTHDSMSAEHPMQKDSMSAHGGMSNHGGMSKSGEMSKHDSMSKSDAMSHGQMEHH